MMGLACRVSLIPRVLPLHRHCRIRAAASWRRQISTWSVARGIAHYRPADYNSELFHEEFNGGGGLQALRIPATRTRVARPSRWRLVSFLSTFKCSVTIASVPTGHDTL